MLRGGLRYVELEQQFSVAYVDGGNNALFHNDNKLNGFGPFVGLGSTWKLPWSLSLEGELGLSLLHSKTVFSSGDDVVDQTTEFEGELTPVLEYSFGGAWQKDLGDGMSFKFAAAYRAQTWGGVCHNWRFLDDVDAGLGTDTVSDLVLQGFIGTIAFEKRF